MSWIAPSVAADCVDQYVAPLETIDGRMQRLLDSGRVVGVHPVSQKMFTRIYQVGEYFLQTTRAAVDQHQVCAVLLEFSSDGYPQVAARSADDDCMVFITIHISSPFRPNDQ